MRRWKAAARATPFPASSREWFDGGSLSNRGMYLSPWTSAKYLWAVAETVGGMDGYRTSGRPHLAPLRPKGWDWVAAARRALGRKAANLSYRLAERRDLRGHAGAVGRRSVYVHLRGPRRERRSDDLARRGRSGGLRRRRGRGAHLRVQYDGRSSRRIAGVPREHRAHRHGRRRIARGASPRPSQRPQGARGETRCWYRRR